MTFIRIGLLALGMAAALSACVTPDKATAVSGPTGSPGDVPERRLELSVEEIWFIDAAGNATHIQSGLTCPLNWGRFKRANLQVFRTDGQDVGCNYEDDRDSLVTLYAYHSAIPVADELTQIMEKAVKIRHPIYEESSIANSRQTGPTGTSVDYFADAITFDRSDGVRMKSGLALADYYGWRTKARVTYPEAIADDIEFFVDIVMLAEQDQLYQRKKQLAIPTAEEPSTTL